MNCSKEQVVKVTAFVNDFGDFIAQDRNTDEMHRCLAMIRHELVDETDPITHPEFLDQLNWIDRLLDRIEAGAWRRFSKSQQTCGACCADD